MRIIKIQLFVYCSFALIVFIDLLFRAINIPLTHDEIATFHHYVQRAAYIPFFSPSDGNNHFLNTFLIYLCYKLFGYSAFIIRLPNIIMYLIYCYFVWKLSGELKAFWLKIMLWIGLFFCIHFIEFFALARGYGMGFSLMTGGLYYYLKASKSSNVSYYYISFILLILACLSLLTLTYTLILLSTWILIREVVNPELLRQKFKRIMLFLVLPALITLGLLSFRIKASGGYIEGSTGDFLLVSISSMLRILLDLSFIDADRLSFAIMIFVLIIFVLLVFVFFRSKVSVQELTDPYLVFFYLLIGNVIFTIASNQLFGLNYPETRMAVYFYPLFILSLIFTFDYFVSKKLNYIYWVLIPIFYLPFHYSSNAFLSYSVWYRYCHIPDKFYDLVMKEYKAGTLPPSIAGHGTQAYAWSAIVKNKGGTANLMETSSFPELYSDYEILEVKYFPGWSENYDTIAYDEVSNLHLLKRKSKAEYEKILDIKHLKTHQSTSQEHLVFYDTIVNQWQGKYFKLDYDFSIETSVPLIGMVVCSVEDADNNNLMFNTIQFNLLSETWEATDHNFMKTMLFKLPERASHMSILIWNLEKTPYNLKTGEITLSVL